MFPNDHCHVPLYSCIADGRAALAIYYLYKDFYVCSDVDPMWIFCLVAIVVAYFRYDTPHNTCHVPLLPPNVLVVTSCF